MYGVINIWAYVEKGDRAGRGSDTHVSLARVEAAY